MKYECLTTSKGIGGIIKNIPEDFIVEEVYDGGVCSIDYKMIERLKDLSSVFKKKKEHTHFVLIKRNYNTFRAINLISKKLRVSKKRFGVAGNKDKLAITSQRVSVWNVPISKLIKVKMKEIHLKNFNYSDKRLQAGHLIGNQFTVKIRDIKLSKEEIEKRLKEFSVQIKKGIPNFFGLQRFGAERQINHLIGEKIASGKFEDSIKMFLVETGDETEEAIKARSLLRESWGMFSEAIRVFPKYLDLERAVLNSLIAENDPIKALRTIPLPIRKLFIHSYQAYLFNKKLNNAVRNKLVPEKILLAPIKVEGMKELNCSGTYRNSFFLPKDFEIIKIEDGSVTISFFLPKGCYATTLLNELMKS